MKKQTNVKAPLGYNDVTNKNYNQKVRQCSSLESTDHTIYSVYDVTRSQNIPADKQEVNQGDSSTQVVQDLYQASKELQNMSRLNIGILRDNAGAASQCKSGGGSDIKPKVPVTLNRLSSEHNKWGTSGKKQSLPLSDDKYSHS